MRNKIISFKKKNQNVIGYGAPARVATITNFSKINISPRVLLYEQLSASRRADLLRI